MAAVSIAVTTANVQRARFVSKRNVFRAVEVISLAVARMLMIVPTSIVHQHAQSAPIADQTVGLVGSVRVTTTALITVLVTPVWSTNARRLAIQTGLVLTAFATKQAVNVSNALKTQTVVPLG